MFQVVVESAMYNYVPSKKDRQNSVQREFSDEKQYWQPASREDDLKKQLQFIQVSDHSLKYVKILIYFSSGCLYTKQTVF